MLKLIKLLKELKGKGFATKEEKALVATEFAKLKSEDQEAVEAEVDEVSALPEETAGGDEGDDNVDEAIEKGIKSLFSREASKIKNEIKTYLDEQRELAQKGAGVYNQDVKAKRATLNTYVKELGKSLLVGDFAKVKEMTTDASGSPYAGYTVDSELSAEIRHLITQYGVAAREMETIQLSKNSYKANNLTTDVTTYWVDEAGSILSTQAVLGQEVLELKKLAVIVSMTAELLEDTEIDFVNFLASRVAEGFAKMEDLAFFMGDGTSTYGSFTGLLNATDVNETVLTGTTFASLTADDLLDMVDDTPSGALANAKYYYNRTIKSIIRKLKDENNNYIYQAPSITGPATVWGYPEVLVEVMPKATDTAADTSFVLFGDLRKACIYGYKGATKVARFDAGTIRNVANNADINLITTDREAIRWTRRVGYIRILPTAVTKLTTASASV